MPPKPTITDPDLGELTCDRITRDFWIYQRAKGHRFSSDDVVTAYVASLVRPEAGRILDLGCGIGSVLLQLAWKLPAAHFTGVEAQDESFELLGRNLSKNHLEGRATVHRGDLREDAVVALLGTGFDLVTGTPPYFPVTAATGADDAQRAYARIEHRGGVEAYLATAGRVVAEDGRVVMCGDARANGRVVAGATAAGLSIHARCVVIPREGYVPLFSVWTLGRAPVGPVVESELVLRNAKGERTADAGRLRAFGGF